MAVGFWLLAFGFWLLAFGCWLLAVGFWPLLLAFGGWLLAFGTEVFNRFLFTVHSQHPISCPYGTLGVCVGSVSTNILSLRDLTFSVKLFITSEKLCVKKKPTAINCQSSKTSLQSEPQ